MARWARAAAIVVVVVFALALPSGVIGLVQYQAAQQNNEACTDRKNQYDALHAVILQQNKPSKVSELVLRALPQFRPFVTPGTPEYQEAQRISTERLAAVLDVLGDRPVC